MGNACSNHLGIPPAKGPNAVGCTDFMMDHTAQVRAASTRGCCKLFTTCHSASGWKVLCEADPCGPPGRGHASGTSVQFILCCLSCVCVCEQGTFFRLYYPCQHTETAEKPDWVPCVEYYNGLADFMKINRTLSEKIFNYLFGNSTTVVLNNTQVF